MFVLASLAPSLFLGSYGLKCGNQTTAFVVVDRFFFVSIRIVLAWHIPSFRMNIYIQKLLLIINPFTLDQGVQPFIWEKVWLSIKIKILCFCVLLYKLLIHYLELRSPLLLKRVNLVRLKEQ